MNKQIQDTWGDIVNKQIVDTGSYETHKQYPCILNYKGKPTPSTLMIKRVSRYGSPTIYIQLPDGTFDDSVIFQCYKLQGSNGKLVDDGYHMIARDEFKEWIEWHKKGAI